METNKLFVSGISWGTSWQDLKDAFKAHGEVVHAKIITDRETGKSRGFGFVEFTNEQDAQKAFQAMNGTELDGREIKVDFARGKDETEE